MSSSSSSSWMALMASQRSGVLQRVNGASVCGFSGHGVMVTAEVVGDGTEG